VIGFFRPERGERWFFNLIISEKKVDKAIVVNIEKCLACKSCEIACALVHSKSKVLEEAVAESPKPQRMVTVEAADEFAVPIQCRHCEAPPCIEICPTGAIQRQNKESPVTVDQDLCIGCKLCMLICPFGVLQIGPEGRAIIKCDMCLERLEKGQEPACVEACPTKAMKLVSLKEFTKPKRAAASKQLAKEIKKKSKEK
jgi:carbon-monoxide dehydrogenase iron sulfur subunit